MSRDNKTILDTKDSVHDAYLWLSMQSDEAWLAYDGDLIDITQ